MYKEYNHQEQGKEEDKSEQRYETTRDALAKFFDQHKDLNERTKLLLSKAKYFLSDEQTDALEAACNIDTADGQTFARQVFPYLKEMVDLQHDNPEEYENRERKMFVESNGYTPVGEKNVFSYGRDGDVAHIHISPSETLTPMVVAVSIRNGLKELARIAEKDESLEEVTAASWLVAENPDFIEKMGFEIDDDGGQQNYQQGRPTAKARMSRDVLLKKYLKKKR